MFIKRGIDQHMKKLFLLIILASFANPEPAWPQSALPSALSLAPNELGKPILTAWLPKDYGADVQNWAIVQDDRGVMYFGNNSGILEYDGVFWRLIQFPNKSVCRSLAKDANGRIYAGGVGDFGYLAPDSVGQMRFVSLLPHLPEGARDFADVWQTFVLQESVYSGTNNYVFRWTPSESALQGSEMAGEIKQWRPANVFHVSFVVDDAFYIREREKGLLRLQGDSLQLVPGGEQFANERIYVMLPFAEDSVENTQHRHAERSRSILVGTRTQGLFLYDGQTFNPFKTEADEYLRQSTLFPPGTVLRDRHMLLNTTRWRRGAAGSQRQALANPRPQSRPAG